MKKIILILLVILIIIGGILWSKNKVEAPAPNSNQTQNISDVKNATYDIDGVLITLKDGQNEQQVSGSVTTTTTSYFGNDSEGDVNGDGKADKAFLLIQDGGGTGLFTYLAVALKNDKATIFISILQMLCMESILVLQFLLTSPFPNYLRWTKLTIST